MAGDASDDRAAAEETDPSADSTVVSGTSDGRATAGEASDGTRRVLEYVCGQRTAITVVFFTSAMFLVVSLFLLAFAPLSPGSRAIAIADVAITGAICAVSLYVLRRCNQLRRGVE